MKLRATLLGTLLLSTIVLAACASVDQSNTTQSKRLAMLQDKYNSCETALLFTYDIPETQSITPAMRLSAVQQLNFNSVTPKAGSSCSNPQISAFTVDYGDGRTSPFYARYMSITEAKMDTGIKCRREYTRTFSTASPRPADNNIRQHPSGYKCIPKG